MELIQDLKESWSDAETELANILSTQRNSCRNQ